MIRLPAAWYWIRSSLWFLPGLMVLSASVLAALSLSVDRAIPDFRTGALLGFYSGGPEGARSVLTAAAQSMVTVAAVIFSITVVALTLASSQFGPRTLRNFMRDWNSQLAFGAFIATFVYCLLVLRTVRGPAGEETSFVPHLSVSIGVLLSLASVAFLVYYIHHLAESIQVDDLIAKVAREMEAQTHRHPVEDVGQAWEPGPGGLGLPMEQGTVWGMDRKGYIQSLDAAGLFRFAVRQDLVLELLLRPGDFSDGVKPFLRIWPPREIPAEWGRRLEKLFILGVHRTPLQDFGYGINLLVEIALRALSPTLNDPFTASMCLDRLGELLLPLAGDGSPSGHRADDAGKLRLLDHPLGFPELLGMALNPLRRAGSGNPMLAGHVLDILAEASRRCRVPEYAEAIALHARAFAREEGWDSPLDREWVQERYRIFLRARGEE